ncbi:alpha-galactosidase [Haladaptatus litoreus]|nr:alpha-galactosidase [Haladaptatus litoreus]
MPIQYVEEDEQWILETKRSAYVFGVGPNGILQQCYWGPRLPHESDYPKPGRTESRPEGYPFDDIEERTPEEYPPWGGVRYKEPAIKVRYSDGTQTLSLRFEGAERREPNEKGAGLVVMLRDSNYDLRVAVEYRLIYENDLLERSATIVNEGNAPVSLERTLSGQLSITRFERYRLTHLAGHWGRETNVERTPLGRAKTTIESRRGVTSHQHNPWFAIDAGTATEHEGEVYFGALAYSGNWTFVFEENSYGDLQISGGIHDFDSAWHLEPGESFETPTLIAGYSAEGFGGGSRNLHDYQRRHVLPDTSPAVTRPIVYNSWYATGLDVHEDQQMRLADRAAEIGCELFVVDAGWFKNATDFATGVGDWEVDKEKFSNGLSPLIDHVKSLGMEFGLWLEPENVNEDSDLYRNHPDWVYGFSNRDQQQNDSRYVLNLAKEEVRGFLHETFDRLLTEYDIDFVKWDMNRPLSDPGWPEADPETEREVWIRHTRGVYEVFDRLRENHPEVILESCSAGGGRVDLGILSRAHQTFPSDDVDPYDRLFVQEGYSHAYAPKTMVNWVTDPWEPTERETNLDYPFHVGMTGVLGIGADISEWTAEQVATAKNHVSQYKEIRPIVQNGDQYRLRSPREHELSAVQYISPDRSRAVVFAFRHSWRYGDMSSTLRLRGLDEDARYRVEGGERTHVRSGKALRERGIEIDLRGDFGSHLVQVTKEE